MSNPPHNLQNSSQTTPQPQSHTPPDAQQSPQQGATQGDPQQSYTPALRAIPQTQGLGSVPHPQGYHGQMCLINTAAYYQHAGSAADQQQPAPGYAPQRIQYISTPPQAVPGVYPNPNSPPLTTAPRSASNPNPQPVRYPCEICGTTFSRPFDRRRHHETHHVEHPPVHQCKDCKKDFARADSLKRHSDGGCDKMITSSLRR